MNFARMFKYNRASEPHIIKKQQIPRDWKYITALLQIIIQLLVLFLKEGV